MKATENSSASSEKASGAVHPGPGTRTIGPYTLDEFLSQVRWFHGYEAPGLVMGGFMVDLALSLMPEDILFNAVSETENCLPDAIQLLTPCTVGNGWLAIVNLGRYALCLYDKVSGRGFRVYVDTGKIRRWPEIAAWFFKEKPKAEQDAERLLADIMAAGAEILSVIHVIVNPVPLTRGKKGRIAACPRCGEAYPLAHGGICRACQGTSLYVYERGPLDVAWREPAIAALPAEKAIGRRLLHDVTEIEPGVSKGPLFRKGHVVEAGDLCRLQKLGRNLLYVEDAAPDATEWVHENDAARAFAKGLAGSGVFFVDDPREGKIGFTAGRDGLFTADAERLLWFNSISGVMCAVRRSYSVVKKGDKLGATRAVPLYLSRPDFETGLAALADGPVFSVLPLSQPGVGILVTGTEVFTGLVKDRFAEVITKKVTAYGCQVVKSLIVPDDRAAIANGVRELLAAGAGLIVTTAGLSVDPEDLTRRGLLDAGLEGAVYGAAALPGAMTLCGRIGSVPVLGVPACALFHKITTFDLILPRLLAGLGVTQNDFARMGHGGFCLECKTCRFPDCTFGG